MNKCEWISLYACSKSFPSTFERLIDDPDFTCFQIEAKSLPLDNDPVLDDLRRIRERGKTAFVRLDYLIFEKNDRPYHCPKKENWRELLDDMNEKLCEAGGEAFIGYYFDEPFYYMTGDEYLELTKYLSKFGKRIFSIHASVHIHMALWPINESHDFQSVAFRSMSHITPENHAYTTDVSYDYYGEWEHGVHHNTVYRLFIERMGDRFEKTKFWFTPPIGTVMTKEWNEKPIEEVEQICIDVFMGFWNWARDIENFGGFAPYTYVTSKSAKTGLVHAGGERFLLPDENGEVKWKKMYPVIKAVIKGFQEGKHPRDIELPEVEYDKGYIV